MTASFRGYVDTVRILIEAKAEVNIQDKVLCSYTHVLYSTSIAALVLESR